MFCVTSSPHFKWIHLSLVDPPEHLLAVTSHLAHQEDEVIMWRQNRSTFYLPGGIRCDVSAAAVSLSSQRIVSRREEERFRVRTAAGSLWVGVGGSAWEDVVKTREDVCGTTDDNVCVCRCPWWEHLSGTHLHNVDSVSALCRSQSFTAMLSIFTHKRLWC